MHFFRIRTQLCRRVKHALKSICRNVIYTRTTTWKIRLRLCSAEHGGRGGAGGRGWGPGGWGTGLGDGGGLIAAAAHPRSSLSLLQKHDFPLAVRPSQELDTLCRQLCTAVQRTDRPPAVTVPLGRVFPCNFCLDGERRGGERRAYDAAAGSLITAWTVLCLLLF